MPLATCALIAQTHDCVVERRYPRSDLAAPARSTNASWRGRPQACSPPSGKQGLPNMTKWKESHGDGKAFTGPCSKRRWRKRRSFNQFRKLLVRYEKLERSFVALNPIAAAIIALRKVKLTINAIYG